MYFIFLDPFPLHSKTQGKGTYPEAVNLAKENAKCGEAVVLSPASTSFDMFKNFEERGNLFKELVNNL